MDMSGDHSRWFHPSMYPLYPESSQHLISNGIPPTPSGQSYSNENHYYNNHQDGAPHSSYHPLCHPISPHSPPSINSTDSNTNCGSRLYLPNGCASRGSHYSTSNTPNNSSSMWQHISSPPSTLSLPQYQSSHIMKVEDHSKGLGTGMDSSHYNPDDLKFKLSQNPLQNYSGFSPQLYGSHLNNTDFGPNGFDMMTGLPRCRTSSRSNSGKCILNLLSN